MTLFSCNNKQEENSTFAGKSKKLNTIDSLNIVFEKLKTQKYDTIVREKINDLGIQFYSNSDTTSYYKCLKTIEAKSSVAKDTFGLIRAKTNLGMLHVMRLSSDSAYFYLTKAEKLSMPKKGQPFLGTILLYKANLLLLKKEYTGAEVTAIKALKIAKEKNYLESVFSSYTIIANSLLETDKEDEALFYYNKALDISSKISDVNYSTVFKAQTYNYIANVYQKKENHIVAIEFLKKGLENQKLKIIDIHVYNYLQNNLGYSYLKLDRKIALQIFEEVKKSSDSLKYVATQISARINLAEYYLKYNNNEKAKSYCLEAKSMARESLLFDDQLKALELLSVIDPKNNSVYQKEFIKLNDSLQKIERTTRDKFARIEFETDEITKQKEIVEEEKNDLFTRLILISGFGLLSIMLIVLWYKNQSQKTKTKQLLLEQEHQKDKEEIYQLMLAQQQKIEEGKQIEKRRISQELHDGVMGKLSSIRMNLYVLNKKTDPDTITQCLNYIKEIQNIEKEIRTISHELNSNLFSDNVNFVSIVENLFTAIKNHSDINFHLKVDEQIDWETVNNNIKINIYRIIQEALQNIDKYANAQNVFIKMVKTEGNISIEIKDDGVGFDLNNKKTGIGLKNMHARMEEIKGKFSIESKPHNGTKINLIIPN